APSSSPPASDVIDPPSNDATTSRRSTGAKPNKSGIHSVGIGVPRSTQKAVVAKQLSQSQDSDAPLTFEKSGLGANVRQNRHATYSREHMFVTRGPPSEACGLVRKRTQLSPVRREPV